MKDYKIQRLGGGHRTCNKCGETIFGSKVHHCKKAIASDAVLGDRAEVIELFRWLLGYDDFPIRMDGEGLYYWRKELRQKLKDIGIVIK